MTRKRLDKHQNALFVKIFWGKWFTLELNFLDKFLKRGHILKLRLPSKSIILNSSYWNHLQRIAQVTDDFSNLSRLDQEISTSVHMLLENTCQTYQDLAAHIRSFWGINPIKYFQIVLLFIHWQDRSKDELGLIGYFTCLHTVTFFTQLLMYMQSFTPSILNNGQRYLIDTCKREVNDRNLWLVLLSPPQKPLWIAPFQSSHRPPRAFYLFLLA